MKGKTLEFCREYATREKAQYDAFFREDAKNILSKKIAKKSGVYLKESSDGVQFSCKNHKWVRTIRMRVEKL